MSGNRRELKELPITLLSCDPSERASCETWIQQALQLQKIDLQHALKHPQSLPLVWFQQYENETPPQLTIFCIGPFRQRFFKYFYEFCLQIGAKEASPDPVSYSTIDFHCPSHPSYHRLTLCKIGLQLQSQSEIDHLIHSIEQSHPHLKTGLWTGNFSDWSIWRQSAAEDEKVASLCKRWSDLSVTMPPELAKITGSKLHQLIVSLSKSLLNERTSRHIIDIARSMALPIWKQMETPKPERSSKRRCWVEHSTRHVLSNDRLTRIHGYTITLNYLRSHESLEERQLILALRQLHLAHGPAHFFIHIKDPETKFHHLYLELPSENSSEEPHPITPQRLRDLSQRVLNGVERKQLRIFQPRNDEDSLKRLVILAKEVQNPDDLAQVALSFDEQTDDRLIFHLQMARPLNPSEALDPLTLTPSDDIAIKIDKMRKSEENGLVKQLLLARIEVTKSLFVREDYSVDLHRARIHIMRQLTHLLGPVRDYNGGLIAKQHQLLEQILEKLGPLASHQLLLLEEIYFSLQPSVATSNFDLETLQPFFQQILKCESLRKQHATTPRIYWKSQSNLITLVALSTQADPFERLPPLFQELLRSNHSLIYGEISKTQRHLQYALIHIEDGELPKFKKLLRKQLPHIQLLTSD